MKTKKDFTFSVLVLLRLLVSSLMVSPRPLQRAEEVRQEQEPRAAAYSAGAGGAETTSCNGGAPPPR
jgi:hypothetical protein